MLEVVEIAINCNLVQAMLDVWTGLDEVRQLITESRFRHHSVRKRDWVVARSDHEDIVEAALTGKSRRFPASGIQLLFPSRATIIVHNYHHYCIKPSTGNVTMCLLPLSLLPYRQHSAAVDRNLAA